MGDKCDVWLCVLASLPSLYVSSLSGYRDRHSGIRLRPLTNIHFISYSHIFPSLSVHFCPFLRPAIDQICIHKCTYLPPMAAYFLTALYVITVPFRAHPKRCVPSSLASCHLSSANAMSGEKYCPSW